MPKRKMRLYRYESESIHFGNKPICREFEIVCKTTKGVWVMDPRTLSKKWVSLSGKKRFAYPTKKQAFESFIIRKMRYLENCIRNHERAKRQYIAMKKSELAKGHEKIIAECDDVLCEADPLWGLGAIAPNEIRKIYGLTPGGKEIAEIINLWGG